MARAMLIFITGGAKAAAVAIENAEHALDIAARLRPHLRPKTWITLRGFFRDEGEWAYPPEAGLSAQRADAAIAESLPCATRYELGDGTVDRCALVKGHDGWHRATQHKSPAQTGNASRGEK